MVRGGRLEFVVIVLCVLIIIIYLVIAGEDLRDEETIREIAARTHSENNLLLFTRSSMIGNVTARDKGGLDVQQGVRRGFRRVSSSEGSGVVSFCG